MIAKATVCLVVLFLTIPALVLIVASFSDATFIQFPPKTLGWRQYANFLLGTFLVGGYLDLIGSGARNRAVCHRGWADGCVRHGENEYAGSGVAPGC